ncbi:MAG TPA: hypothetical protein VGW79_01665, partial [Actinomycetota bacterium]|nr:hypothetical protein [Actinomycetota bacterium]
PDLLGMEIEKARLFVCAPGLSAVRWAVAAQQDGWQTILLLDDVRAAGSLRYLATHVDVVVVPDAGVADALGERAAPAQVVVLSEPTPRALQDARTTERPSLPRIVLGID